MAENNAPPAEKVVPLTEPPKEGEAEGEKGPSKGALKKMQKEKEKAEKAAARKAAEEAQKKQAEADDVSKNDYGELDPFGRHPGIPSNEKVPRVKLSTVAEEFQDTSKMDEPEGPHVVFTATVANSRGQSAKLAFMELEQEYNTIQAVIAASETLSRQMVKFTTSIPSQSRVLVHALIKKPKEPVKSTTIQNLEAHIKKIYIVCKADAQLPLQVADAERPIPVEGEEDNTKDQEDGRPIVTLNTRLNNRTIDLRAKHNQAIFAIKAGVSQLFREFLGAHGFKDVQSPALLGAPSEGGANVFEVTYFGGKAYLAQSPQLYKQMLITANFLKVMEVGPVFRAENSNTARHLTEFTGLDMEMELMDETDYHEVVGLLENLMLHIFKGLRSRYSKETDLVRSIYHVEEFKLPEAGKVPRLTFAEGIQMLREDGVEIADMDDLSTPDEKRLGALVLKNYGSDFYVMDKYPLAVRPFYTMPDPATYGSDPNDPNAGYSNSYDFFMRGQEIMSGAQRIHQASFLEKRMKEHVSPVDANSPGLRDYVNAFRAGCNAHAGGGIGLERIVMLWLGLPNVRLASLFPRDPTRLAP
ncbi:aspartyl-tRNA synthetase [Hortaea werneckii]|nr:aspartyl-tRNA synthetase [Hortaea werneckii]